MNSKFSLTDFRSQASWQHWDMDNKTGNDFLYSLLLFSGQAIQDTTTGTHQPISNNAYYFSSEWDESVNYGEIITRLNLLTGNALPLTEVSGHFNSGFTGVTFFYRKEFHRWEMDRFDNWTDESIFPRFIALAKSDLKKQFYMHYDGPIGLILYYTETEVRNFRRQFPNTKIVTLE
ncbi:hypothetical protein [Chryseolinea lacunae]|uniref:Uncharacterized protein n=1 Tax=Chryseolinea lacunae TaxID=2801331 RepID=A0ABS1KJP4_9BACT|nr:hypothetical protein [Chryseolinea lacunae]MBL0739665.1 hypothetical protein [Chryseolinea lacunae]